MKKLLLCTLIFFSISINSFGDEVNKLREIFSTTGWQAKLLAIAVTEFQKSGLNLDNYKVVLVQNNSSYVVIFIHADDEKYQKGSAKNMPGFEVEIGKNFNILRSNYSR